MARPPTDYDEYKWRRGDGPKKYVPPKIGSVYDLDIDLRASVTGGRMSMDRATNIQNERNRTKTAAERSSRTKAETLGLVRGRPSRSRDLAELAILENEQETLAHDEGSCEIVYEHPSSRSRRIKKLRQRLFDPTPHQREWMKGVGYDEEES